MQGQLTSILACQFQPVLQCDPIVHFTSSFELLLLPGSSYKLRTSKKGKANYGVRKIRGEISLGKSA